MRPFSIFCAILAAATVACSDALEKDTTAGQVIAVANAGSASVTLVSATTFAASPLAVATPFAPSVWLAAQDSFVFFPTGAGDTLGILRLTGSGAGVVTRIGFDSGAAAASVGVQDSIPFAWLAEEGRDRVRGFGWTPSVVVLNGVVTGPHPAAVVVVGDTVFVVNANAVNDSAAGPSSITWFTVGASIGAPDSIALTGTNARSAVLGADGLIYVVERGTAGQHDGRVSIVNPHTHTEDAVINGLGELPGEAVYHPSGRLLIAAGANGILEVNTITRSVTRGPGAGIKPDGDSVVALAVDQRGRIYAVSPRGCGGPGVVHVLSPPPDYGELRTVTVGTCPRAAAVAFSSAIP